MATDQQLQHTRMNTVFEALDKPINQSRVNVPKVLFEIDPYSAAIRGIRKSIELGLEHGGAMNNVEYDILNQIKKLTDQLDLG